MKCKIEECKYSGYYLSATHNGYQWTSVNLRSMDELYEVKKYIENYLLENSKTRNSNKVIKRRRN